MNELDTKNDFQLFRKTFAKFIDYLQEPWYKSKLQKDKEILERFYSSKYTIEDAFEVVEEFYNSEGFENYSDGYLKIYGIFQSLYLIQDSLNNIYNIVFDKERNTSIEKNFQYKYSNLLEVRYLRNKISGHPSKNKHFENIYISRLTILKFSFQISKYYPEKTSYKKQTSFQTINLKDQVELQTSAMVDIMQEINNAVICQINNHRLAYKDIKLIEGFHTSRHNFEKTFYFLSTGQDFVYSKLCFEEIQSTYNEKFNQVKERLECIELFEDLPMLDEKIQYLFKRVDSYFSKPNQIEKLEAEILIEKLEQIINDFKDILRELDDKYQKLIN